MREPPPIRTGELPNLTRTYTSEGEKMLGCELGKSENRHLGLGTSKEQKTKTEAGPRDRGVQSNPAPSTHHTADPKPKSITFQTPSFCHQNGDSKSLKKKREKKKSNKQKKKGRKNKNKKKGEKAKKKKEKGQDSAQKCRHHHPPYLTRDPRVLSLKRVYHFPPKANSYPLLARGGERLHTYEGV